MKDFFFPSRPLFQTLDLLDFGLYTIYFMTPLHTHTHLQEHAWISMRYLVLHQATQVHRANGTQLYCWIRLRLFTTSARMLAIINKSSYREVSIPWKLSQHEKQLSRSSNREASHPSSCLMRVLPAGSRRAKGNVSALSSKFFHAFFFFFSFTVLVYLDKTVFLWDHPGRNTKNNWCLRWLQGWYDHTHKQLCVYRETEWTLFSWVWCAPRMKK